MKFRRQAMQTESFLGKHLTERTEYRPFEDVVLTLHRRKAASARVFVYDARQGLYAGRTVVFTNGRGRAVFAAAGAPGTHQIIIHYEDGIRRYCFFRLRVRTRLVSGCPEFDDLQGYLEAVTSKCCTDPEVGGRRVSLAGRAGDSSENIWMRDGGYGLLGYVYWHPYLKEFCDFFFASQDRFGFFRGCVSILMRDTPDERKKRMGRCFNEPDLEYIAVLLAHRVWQATGDTAWLRRCVGRLERGLRAIMAATGTQAPKMRRNHRVISCLYRCAWHAPWGLVKRPHTCDTWDCQIDRPDGSPVYVAAVCDQSGYYQAMRLMERIYAILDRPADAARWGKHAERLYTRAQKHLWDGEKFRHHKHIDDLDHGKFDESRQLAMGNTWAMNRGLATHEQCVSILRVYRERWRATGDKFPWWSLQPGYPTSSMARVKKTGFWNHVRGAYANGGLIPWVGGELALAALEHGCEAFGIEQVRAFHALLKKHRGGMYTWYWPDGEPGQSAPSSTNHSIWDVGAWMRALQEGLAGIRDGSVRWRDVECAPRWPAAGVRNVMALSAYPENNDYFGYTWSWDARGNRLRMHFSGTGERVRFSILLPNGKRVSGVTVDQAPVDFETTTVERSRYVCFTVSIKGSVAAQAFSEFKERTEEKAIPVEDFDLNRVEVSFLSSTCRKP